MPTNPIIPPGLVRQPGLGFTQVLPAGLARIKTKGYYPEISGGVFQVPASGPTVVHGSGSINGYTSPAVPAQPPPALIAGFSGSYSDDYKFQIITNLSSPIFSIQTSDPFDGSVWIDSSGFTSTADFQAAVGAAIDGNTDSGTSWFGLQATILSNSTGLASTISGVNIGFNTVSISGGGQGTDSSPASGWVDNTELYPAVIGKTLKVQSTSQKILTFVAAEVINWNGNVALTYHGYGDIFYFNPFGQVLSDGTSYSIDDLVASFGGVIDAAVLANGFPEVGISLDFSPAVSIDQDFPYGSATVTNINLTES